MPMWGVRMGCDSSKLCQRWTEQGKKYGVISLDLEFSPTVSTHGSGPSPECSVQSVKAHYEMTPELVTCWKTEQKYGASCDSLSTGEAVCKGSCRDLHGNRCEMNSSCQMAVMAIVRLHQTSPRPVVLRWHVRLLEMHSTALHPSPTSCIPASSCHQSSPLHLPEALPPFNTHCTLQSLQDRRDVHHESLTLYKSHTLLNSHHPDTKVWLHHQECILWQCMTKTRKSKCWGPLGTAITYITLSMIFCMQPSPE